MTDHSMTKKERLALIHMHHDRLDHLEQHQPELVESYMEKHHWVFSHDLDGNWIGHVANENGWTA